MLVLYAPQWLLASQFGSYSPPPPSWLFRDQKIEFLAHDAYYTITALEFVNFRPTLRIFFRRKFSHSDFDSRKQQAILPY